MSKKNKRKNNGYNNSDPQEFLDQSNQKKVTAPSLVFPTVTTVTPEEIKATPDLKVEVDAAIEKARDYATKKMREVDEYYEKKKEAADELLATQVTKVEEAKEAAKEEGKREAEAEAKEILAEAKQKAEETRKSLEGQKQELDKQAEQVVKDQADIDKQRVNYKAEVLASIQEDQKALKEENEQLNAQVVELNKAIKKKDKELALIHEDDELNNETYQQNLKLTTENKQLQGEIDNLKATYEGLNEVANQRKEEIANLNKQILTYGDDPRKLLEKNDQLEKENKELSDRLADMPSPEELEKLRNTSIQYEGLSKKLDDTKKENLRLTDEKFSNKVDLDELESYRKFIKILELQKSELQSELDRNIQLYNNQTKKVFASLSEIDKKQVLDYGREGISLKRLCTNFRAYLQNRTDKVRLYYSDQQIRTFIAGFAASRLTILEGLSGTGKSSLPVAFGDYTNCVTKKVSVQSSWKDRNDLLGFYNDFKKQYKETEFLKALYFACHDPKNIHIIVLDEMNLSRIEYYFSDFLNILESSDDPDQWIIPLISDAASVSQNSQSWPDLIHDGALKVLPNTWFVGTANKDDSTFTITDKVYDRSVVLRFEEKGKSDPSVRDCPETIHLSSTEFETLLNRATRFKSSDAEEEFNEMIKFLDEQVRSYFEEITFGNRIANQLSHFVPAYMECGGTMEEAVDIMFARKGLRKLEGLFDDNTKDSLGLLEESIKEKYGNKLPITVSTIDKMIKKI